MSRMRVQNLLPTFSVDVTEVSDLYRDCIARGERPPAAPAFVWYDRLDHAFSVALTNEEDFSVLLNYYAELGRFRELARAGATALAVLLHQSQSEFPGLDEAALVRDGIIQRSGASEEEEMAPFYLGALSSGLYPPIFRHELVDSDHVHIDAFGLVYGVLSSETDAEGLARSLREFQTSVVFKSLESVFYLTFCTVVSYGQFQILVTPLTLRLSTDVTHRLTHRVMTGEEFATWLVEHRRLADYMDELALLEDLPDSDFLQHCGQKVIVLCEPKKKKTLTDDEIEAVVLSFERLRNTRIATTLSELDSPSQGKIIVHLRIPLIRGEVACHVIAAVVKRRFLLHIARNKIYIGDCVSILTQVVGNFLGETSGSLLALEIYEECHRDLITDYGVHNVGDCLSYIANKAQLLEIVKKRFPFSETGSSVLGLVNAVLEKQNVSVDKLVFEPLAHVCHPLVSFTTASEDNEQTDQVELVLDISKTMVRYSLAAISGDDEEAEAAMFSLGNQYMRLSQMQSKPESRELFLSVGSQLGDAEVRAFCARTEELCEGLVLQGMEKLEICSHQILVVSEGCRGLFERFRSYEVLLPLLKSLVPRVERLLGHVHGISLGFLIRLGQTYVRSGADLHLREALKIFGKTVGIASQLVEVSLADETERKRYVEMLDFSRMFFAEIHAKFLKFDEALLINSQLSVRGIPALLQRAMILRDHVATLASTRKFAEALSAGAKWRRTLADLQTQVEIAKIPGWRVFVAVERLRCEVWLLDKEAISDFWDALLLSENEKGALAAVSERPNLVNKVLIKYAVDVAEYNEDKAEQRVFLWEQGSRKYQVLDAGLKEAAELLLLEATATDDANGRVTVVAETSALDFLRKSKRSISVHVFACCSWISPRVPAGQTKTAGPILAIPELNT